MEETENQAIIYNFDSDREGETDKKKVDNQTDRKKGTGNRQSVNFELVKGQIDSQGGLRQRDRQIDEEY